MNFWQTFGIACIPFVITIVGAIITYLFSIGEFKRKEVYKIKEAVILQSLNYIDDYISWLTIDDGKNLSERKMVENPEFTIKGREIYNELCVTCKNRKLILSFSEILFDKNKNIFVEFIEYRKLARKELGLKKIKFDVNTVHLARIATNNMNNKQK